MTNVGNLSDDTGADMLWFAMSATFGRELKAKAFLEKNNVECFVPMRYEIAKVRDGKKTKQLVPAVKNLIFVHTTRQCIQSLKSGVEYLQYHTLPAGERRVPITVPEYQMQQFIAACNTFNEKLIYLAPDEINLQEGTPVRIVGGSFDGIEGTFVRIEKGKRKKVVVLAEGIAAVIIANLNDGYIQVLDI